MHLVRNTILILLTLITAVKAGAESDICDDVVLSLYWFSNSEQSNAVYKPMVVSNENRDLNINMVVNPKREDVKSIEFTFESEEGYVGLNTRAFVFSEIWASNQWVAKAKFDKDSPLGTYYATVTVTKKDGEAHTCTHLDLQESYWYHSRNLYGIQFVDTVRDMAKSSVDLTEFSMPDSVDLSGVDKSMNITLGFSSPIGVWQGSITICPVGKDCSTSGGFLCYDYNSVMAGLPELQLNYEVSHQIDGDFNKGLYSLNCEFSEYAKPGIFEFSIYFTDYARNRSPYSPSRVEALGFNTTIVVNP